MTPQLTSEMRHALNEGEGPVAVENEQTGRVVALEELDARIRNHLATLR